MLAHERLRPTTIETPSPQGCPHCKGHVVIISQPTPGAEFSFHPYQSRVQCKKCDAKGPHEFEFRDAIVSWNTYCDKFKQENNDEQNSGGG